MIRSFGKESDDEFWYSKMAINMHSPNLSHSMPTHRDLKGCCGDHLVSWYGMTQLIAQTCRHVKWWPHLETIIIVLKQFFVATLTKVLATKRRQITVFVPLAAQGAYQSHFRWVLIKTLIYRFFPLKLVIFKKKINRK